MALISKDFLLLTEIVFFCYEDEKKALKESIKPIHSNFLELASRLTTHTIEIVPQEI